MTSIIHPRLFAALSAFFPDQVTIVRDAAPVDDPLGNPGTPSTTTILANAACRFIEKTEVVKQDETTQGLVVTRYVIDLPLADTADVRERDRVSQIVRADGSILVDAFTVKGILNWRDGSQQYSTIELERVS